MLWIVLVAVGCVVGLLVLTAVIGVFLRADHQIARTAVIPRPPGVLWPLIADLDLQGSWRPGMRTVERLPPIDGKPAFRETTRQGVVTFAVDEEIAPSGDAPGRRVTRIADDKLPFSGRWIVTLVPAGDGTRVTITEDGAIKNPVFRTMSRTVFSLAATQEAWLRALARHSGAGDVRVEPAVPEA